MDSFPAGLQPNARSNRDDNGGRETPEQQGMMRPIFRCGSKNNEHNGVGMTPRTDLAMRSAFASRRSSGLARDGRAPAGFSTKACIGRTFLSTGGLSDFIEKTNKHVRKAGRQGPQPAVGWLVSAV
jgi:hypothetical protein